MESVKFNGKVVNVEREKELLLNHIENKYCEIDEVISYEDNGKTIKVNLVLDGEKGYMAFNRRKDGYRLISSSL